MDIILTWDLQLLYWINSSLQETLLEDVLILIRNKYVWIPLYFAIITYVFSRYDVRVASFYFLFIVTAVSITDITSSRIVKNTVQRARPCQDPGVNYKLVQRVHCSYSYSFTSSHATNHFGIATLLVLLFGRGRRWVSMVFFAWAGLISIAQVFVGVHYPLDILAGACLGIALVRIWHQLFMTWVYPSTEQIA